MMLHFVEIDGRFIAPAHVTDIGPTPGPDAFGNDGGVPPDAQTYIALVGGRLLYAREAPGVVVQRLRGATDDHVSLSLQRIADVLEQILQFAKEDAERYAPKEPADVSSR